MVVQHLVSTGGAMGARAVMLAALSEGMSLQGDDLYAQIWFREENTSARRLFGTMGLALPDSLCSIRRYAILGVYPDMFSVYSCIAVRECRPDDADAIYRLAQETRGTLYADCEELRESDLDLRWLDDVYKKVGLRRFRKIWLASVGGESEPAGAAIAYRGPLGLNFSYLENRCDLIISPRVPQSLRQPLAESLLAAASGEYETFSPRAFPVTADEHTAAALQHAGAESIRRYTHLIWHRDGHPDLYQHIVKLYDKVAQLGSSGAIGIGNRR